MPRYLFHVHDRTSRLDEDGLEFPDLESARREAVLTCGEMLREVPPCTVAGSWWFLWVTNQPTDGGETLVCTENLVRAARRDFAPKR
jgi:hypothetical protein